MAMLPKSKLNSIETSQVSQALIDLEISHEELKQLLMKQKSMTKMIESIRNIKSSDILNKEESKNLKQQKL